MNLENQIRAGSTRPGVVVCRPLVIPRILIAVAKEQRYEKRKISSHIVRALIKIYTSHAIQLPLACIRRGPSSSVSPLPTPRRRTYIWTRVQPAGRSPLFLRPEHADALSTLQALRTWQPLMNSISCLWQPFGPTTKRPTFPLNGMAVKRCSTTRSAFEKEEVHISADSCKPTRFEELRGRL